jgi:NAD-dependent DNA ligase
MTDVEKYLVSSYLYYLLDQSFMTDWEYDQLCLKLLTNYEKLPSTYKHLFSVEDLRAGTGHQIREEDYPPEIRAKALSLAVNYD